MAAVAALAPASTLLSARAALGRPTLRSHAVPALSSRARGTCMRVAAQKGSDEDKGFKTSPLVPAFTRRREHTLGRVAALGFAFSLVGELLTGIGPITQLQYETGLSYRVVYLLVGALAAYGLVGAALSPATRDPRNQADVAKRQPANPLQEPRRFLAQNEVLIGRLAMIGFAGACVLEYVWGGEAPLVHLGLVQPATPLVHAPWWAIGLVLLFIANGLGVFSAVGQDDDQAF